LSRARINQYNDEQNQTHPSKELVPVHSEERQVDRSLPASNPSLTLEVDPFTLKTGNRSFLIKEALRNKRLHYEAPEAPPQSDYIPFG